LRETGAGHDRGRLHPAARVETHMQSPAAGAASRGLARYRRRVAVTSDREQLAETAAGVLSLEPWCKPAEALDRRHFGHLVDLLREDLGEKVVDQVTLQLTAAMAAEAGVPAVADSEELNPFLRLVLKQRTDLG
jgi:hypothetical protein